MLHIILSFKLVILPQSDVDYSARVVRDAYGEVEESKKGFRNSRMAFFMIDRS